MQKHITILTALLISGASFSQVGINTTNPQGIFNIDGGKDNPTTGSAHTNAQQLNDFTVTAAGNVGIGKIDPSTKLYITTGGTATTPKPSGFRLEDGNQNKNFVLTSDDNGVGTWKPVAVTRIVGILGAGIDVPFITLGGVYRKTGSYIDLPPGKWEVRVTMLMPVGGVSSGPLPGGGTMTVNDWVWLKTAFSTLDQATIDDNDILSDINIEGSSLVSNLFSGPKSVSGEPKFNMMNGSVMSNKPSTTSKR